MTVKYMYLTCVFGPDNEFCRKLETGIKGDVGIAIYDQELFITAGEERCVYKVPLADPSKKSVILRHNDMVYPHYIAASSHILAVSCQKKNGSNNIMVFEKNGSLVFTFGGKPEGSGPTELNLPCGLAIHRDQYIIAADCLNNRLVILSVGGLLCGHIDLDGKPVAVALDKLDNIIVSLCQPNKVVMLKLTMY